MKKGRGNSSTFIISPRAGNDRKEKKRVRKFSYQNERINSAVMPLAVTKCVVKGVYT